MHFKTQLALIDMLDAIAPAERFPAGMFLEEFAASRLHFFAACRGRRSWGAGNVYRHGYDNVEESMVWSAIKNDLPPLRAVVELALRDA